MFKEECNEQSLSCKEATRVLKNMNVKMKRKKYCLHRQRDIMTLEEIILTFIASSDSFWESLWKQRLNVSKIVLQKICMHGELCGRRFITPIVSLYECN